MGVRAHGSRRRRGRRAHAVPARDEQARRLCGGRRAAGIGEARCVGRGRGRGHGAVSAPPHRGAARGRRPLKTLTPGMRRLLTAAAVLVFLAGVQLFVFPGRTARYFAWTINPPLTAAFLGASYWSSVGFELAAARERTWAQARIAAPAVFVFTVLTLVVTLVHIDRFHFGPRFEPATRAVTWIWLAIYSIVPVMMVLL